MKLFSQFRKKLIRQYMQLTCLIVFILITLIYAFIGSLVYNNFISQAHMLAMEEIEELNYIVNENNVPLDLPPDNSSSQKYLTRIFYYMYDKDNRLIKMSNKIDWSRAAIASMAAQDTLQDGQSKIHMVFTDRNDFRFFVISRESIWTNGQYSGKVYAGFDISHNLMFLGRLLLWLILLLICTLFMINKAANFMANKAMRPIIESFEKQILFAANASHELRTPLSVLLSGLDVLKDDTDNKLSRFSQEILADMTDEILKMKALISNMLLLARCDSSAVSFQKSKLPTTTILENTAARFKTIAADKDITLTMSNNTTELYAYANYNHVEQILSILLDNAIKYTPKNGKISLQAYASNDAVIISVTNTGAGIPAKDLPYVFERFYRSTAVQKHEGSGLGLSIAKALAEKNNGAISVQSEENKQTTFTLYLLQKD